MTNNSEAIRPAPIDAPQTGLRSIRDIIADLSKPVNAQRLKVRTEERRCEVFSRALSLRQITGFHDE